MVTLDFWEFFCLFLLNYYLFYLKHIPKNYDNKFIF